MHVTGDRLSHLDALRAAAVLLVLLYHFHVPGFAQGYLGVDLFLLLSGFLMTWTMLRDRSQHGRFRIAAFYARRMRRILPSLLIVIAAVILLGYALLSPHDLHRTVKESLYAMTFVSNIYFFLKSGYFDPAMESRPFLHTWSLSVEEQFYLLFGLLLYLANKGMGFSRLLSIGLAVALPVLVFSAAVSALHPSASVFAVDIERAAFFLLPFRLPLLLGGALVGWWYWHALRDGPGRHKWQPFQAMEWPRLALALAGFMLVSLASLPPVTASLVVLITWLPLLTGGRNLARLGQASPVLWLARISYQVYLVHWPLLVFFRLVFYREPSGLESAGLLFLSIALGWWVWKAADSLSSATRRSFRPLSQMAILLIALLVMQGVAMADRGARWRLPEERLHPSSRQYRDMQDAFCDRVDHGRQIRCVRDPDSKMAVTLLVGDSFTDHLVPGLVRHFPGLGFMALGSNACPPQIGISDQSREGLSRHDWAQPCIQANAELHARLESMLPTRIIMAFRLPAGLDEETASQVDRLLVREAVRLTARLERYGHRVLWISPPPVPGKHMPSCLSAPAWLPDSFVDDRCRFPETALKRAVTFERRFLKALPGKVVATSHVLCPGHEIRGAAACRIRDRNGAPLFRDESHLTPAGSALLVAHLRPDLERFLGIRAASTSLGISP